MSKENGFAPIRRGLWEHVRDGRLSLQDAAVYQYIISQADTRTGIWKGSAGALSGELGMRSSRAARHVLERLEHGDYIRRFSRPGERFCYPILVHKFQVTQGEHEGEVVDALSSSLQNGCLDLSYFSRQVKGEVKGEVSAPQRRSDTGELRKTHTPSVSELPVAEGFERFYAAYPRKKAPIDAAKAWRQKVKPEEAEYVLARLEMFKQGEWRGKEMRFIPYPATWLRGQRWNEEIEKGGSSNGNSSVGDRMQATLNAAFGAPKAIM